MQPIPTTKISIDSGTIVRFLGFVILVVLIFVLRDVVLTFIASVVIASSIEPFTEKLEKRGVPRLLSVIGIYVGTAIFVVSMFYFFAPPLVDDISNIISRAPEYIDSLQIWGESGNSVWGGKILSSINSDSISMTQIADQLKQSAVGIGSGAFGFFSGAFGGLMSFILIIVLSFYFAVQKDGIDTFLRIVTPIQKEEYIINLWKRSQRKMGRWLQGQFILGLIVGVLVYLGLTIIGVKSAFLLAILAGFLEIIPLFGPIIAAIPAIAIALIDGGLSSSIMVIGLYLIVQQFENHLIYPLVVKKVVGVPPLLVIVSLVIGAQLAGFLGILLSVPIIAAIMEYTNDVEARKKKLHENMKAMN
ncbi:hypothetical protein COW81_02380 [Candidatus Campbellbacteria bacterium CG22_combo_CG10-13_8_21_14_all_36_13]|uniref:AI-2E family transporter n=1 Tax=Candidatus Campbellbacteria bacterium CG22_combo_CG10-13_8_21_14_all_36_13 TaxID=1974529 RepID=A0A2H0DXZ3_9BACT|nr:MAG: hypothetical protein COW81_02380 [Candidatus Campbellbacteria bacterium CG22_combo_CG10-13_8_21_14_all_36_13]